MSTKVVRIPLAWPIGSRSGSDTTKDPYIFNGMVERYGDKNYVVKRPGTDTFITLGSGGTSQGIFYYNGFYYGVVDDVLYRSPGTNLTGIDGTAWTQQTTPAWIAREGFGAVVFQNQMWMIGGAPTPGSGIWSTQDGEIWSVNAGGQPWGFRSNMGCVVFKDRMWVLGGLNLTLLTTFADIWSTPDGTNWSLTTSTPGWSPRYRHMAVAANNGIYIMGGIDSIGGTKLNDVWFSADGETWSQLTAAASWPARDGAATFFFKNQIWVVGGLDASGIPLNDVWYSQDGITWNLATAAAFSGGGRYDMQACVYAGQMWVMGGFTPAASSEVYLSDSGAVWFFDTNSPGWTGRGNGAALPFRTPNSISQYNYESLWLIGGDIGFAAVQEVWVSNINLNQPLSFNLSPTEFQQPYQFNTYVNGTQMLLKNQSNFWVLQGAFLAKVQDSNYPPVTVPGLVVLNAFAYVMTPQGRIQGCKLENPNIWPSLQFLTADYEDDAGVALAKYLNYVVAFGQFTTQFFYDNGLQQQEGIALAPYINANLRVGCASAESVANISNTLFWVAQTRQGTRYVAMLNGMSDQKVSTPYVDKILATISANQLVGFGFSGAGHFFYAIKTGVFTALVYDITQQEWYEWDTFGYGAFISNGNTGGNFLWSTSGGNLVLFGPLYNTDVLIGDYVFYPLTDKIDFGNTALKFYGRVTLVGDTSPATPTIQWTDDDYQSYVTGGTVDMTLERPYITRLGSARRRAWKPFQEDGNPARWEALEIEYSQGES